MRYRAFISYSHADEAWARWLMRRLETWRVPSRLVGTDTANGPIGARLGAFFCDRDELTASGDLGSTIRSALADSDFLIVICSPAAAASRWVDAEIVAFRGNGRGDRVLAFVVAGEPGMTSGPDACFPTSLVAPGADGQPTEPLAADARRSGDGRDRAFLKLAAGLLGVSFDALAQRDAQRRQRRLAVVAAASVSGMAIAIGLAATAWLARNDAQRRQAQAEDILGFMLGDLRKKLTTVGRIDLMHSVDDKATQYFATLDPRDLSDRALEEQARSLTGIGQVRLDEGKHDAAMEAFNEALKRSSALYEREPTNGQRLFDRAQAEYWIGHVALQQGRLVDTATWFTKYRESALRLAAMDRKNFAWQREVAYAHYNLAVLDESRGDYAEAERIMRDNISLYRGWTSMRPADTALRYEAANVASWLGSLALRRGRLQDAERFFTEEMDDLKRNAQLAPTDVTSKSEQVESLAMLAEAQALQAKMRPARASIDSAAEIAIELTRKDPANNDWRSSLGICRWWQAMLAPSASGDHGLVAADDSIALLSSAHAHEPANERVLTWLVRAHQLKATLSLSHGQDSEASRQAAISRSLIEPAWSAGPTEDLRLWLARNHLLEGDIAIARADRAGAIRSWTSAKQLLLAGRQPIPFPRVDPLVRALIALGNDTEAAPYRQQLDASGYVPIRAFVAPGPLASR